MEILYLLIPLAIAIMLVAVWAFVWSVKSGQFDDLEGPAHRILMDDDDPMIPRPDQPADKPSGPSRPSASPEASRPSAARDGDA
ncbi:MAG TPA: cbb3-type cytochrome oxidase assembly protein CcoS [Plasticicumulans sp.]|uniref:cbb3-type cytochrome oxidase assembly protein CcoS n=1 Tax=Plasticicumulans sp. TaxID=2307179 RepID=UPI000FBE7A33|nr:cbb3-type cytochrome oxidase assembly protein CcoS [Plasticicumulans sp.]RTL03246.1 MAG: cbb3-type cytochrome oxidase assembly protein CcoS [Xanthomonadales bacterium]HMV38776.1 cbb3-type cytochrome oxidase assembly protein CcoS [Plasticicumulans sp.]HMW41175.1 cbb3-type cytochrome oxidase assembly protein CcoS [Plasticicumulans sp.]HMZ09219.1 cbb3-type cytochrome oxidase assembly protein CcoS [Plasticicumulans sp.]HND98342.1 cbb3-type cytochrome oxidase assembly protein CcoS [Plasticicumul